MLRPEIVDYPDGGRFGMRLQKDDGAGGKKTVFRFIGRTGSAVDYRDGE